MSYLVDLSPLSLSTGQYFDARSIHDTTSYLSGSTSPGWSSALEHQGSMTDLSDHAITPIPLMDFPKFTVHQSDGSNITISVEYPNSTVVDVILPVAVPDNIQRSSHEFALDNLYVPGEDLQSTSSTPRPLSVMSATTAPSIRSDITQEGDYDVVSDTPMIHQIAHRPQIIEFNPKSYAASLIDADDRSSWAGSLEDVWNSMISNLSVEDLAKIYTPPERYEKPEPVWWSNTTPNGGGSIQDQPMGDGERGLVRSNSSIFSDVVSALSSKWSHAYDALKGYVKRYTSDSRLNYDGLDPHAWDRECQLQLEAGEQSDTLYCTENLPPVGHLPNGSQVEMPVVRRKSSLEDRLYDVDNLPPADHPESNTSSQLVVARNG